mmetsp:Transcript_52284/g.67052  ORF Transcript_52284/g.67052 Transcript_52284/m.67052 type:complete len:114 (+) Transcript_52284:71-412(+)
MTVTFSDNLATVVGYQLDDTNPLLSFFSFESREEVNSFMRISLTKIRGKSPGLLQYNGKIMNEQWRSILNAYESGFIQEDINDIIVELWPWIPPPPQDGRWTLAHIQDLLKEA